MFTDERLERLQRLSDAWSDAEEAIKIAEAQLGDVVMPAIKELRYAGRKLTKSLSNYQAGHDLEGTDRVLEDAIFDCFRARHDATDAATAAVSLSLDLALKTFGADELREKFPEYTDLASKLVVVRRKISVARQDANGRHDLYEELERAELPEIVALFERFKIAETLMKKGKFSRFLARQGVNIGWFIALVVAIVALWD